MPRLVWDGVLGLHEVPDGDWSAAASFERAAGLKPGEARWHAQLGNARTQMLDLEGVPCL